LSAPPAVSAFVPALVDTSHEYHHLFSIYVPIAVGVFVLIAIAVTFAVARYRGRAPQRAARWHENNLLESSYALLLAGVVAFLLYLTFTAEHRVDTVANQQHAAVTIDVTASKWEWRFRYLAYGITLQSGTVGRQQVVVPANEPVRFELRTIDVIHSF
jgi:cytochrome c oxidase subunit 2